MKQNKFALMISLVLLGVFVSADASAHRGRIGVYLDVWPWYYPPPAYSYYPPYPYYPPVVTTPVAPPTYIERSEEQAQPAPATNYWYYCDKPQGYYPYVRQCQGGWQKVPPQPPAP